MVVVLALIVLLADCSSPTSPTPAPPPVVPPPVVVTPPIITPPAPTRNPLLDDPRFSLSFYRQLALDGFELPTNLQRLSRWTRAPFVYLRTVDERNAPVDPFLLDQTAAAIINTTAQWTGGSFGVAGLERGTGTKEGQPGWLTITWRSSGTCGTTFGVGLEGGSIAMNHLRRECTCGPLVVKHELGHAMGFWHTDSPNDLMTPTFQGVCDKGLSAREVFHAKLAYVMPLGSFDPF